MLPVEDGLPDVRCSYLRGWIAVVTMVGGDGGVLLDLNRITK